MLDDESSYEKPIYLVDTSAFVEFEKLYSLERWGPIWDFLSDQVEAGRIVTIDDVVQELEKKFYDEKITKWVVARREKIRFEKTPKHFEYLSSVVLPTCVGLMDVDFVGTLYADPELLSVAGKEGFTLVTSEVRREAPNTKPKNLGLPNHCDKLGIPSISGKYALPEFLGKLGLVIERTRVI